MFHAQVTGFTIRMIDALSQFIFLLFVVTMRSSGYLGYDTQPGHFLFPVLSFLKRAETISFFYSRLKRSPLFPAVFYQSGRSGRQQPWPSWPPARVSR